MYLPDFDYYDPGTLEEACELLARFSPKAKVIAGGTDVLTKMKQGMLVPEVLVSLKRIKGMNTIEYMTGKGVIIGAKATPNDIAHSPLLQKKYPSVVEAAASMANNQIRNLGTVGGNLVNAVPSADLPPILIALHSAVTLISPRGPRVLPLEDFFSGPNRSVIAEDEILTEVVIPDQPHTGSAYFKFGLRHSGALAVVGVAAAVVVQNGLVQSTRIALGAVAPTPMRAKKAEEILIGKSVIEDLLEEAGQMAAKECNPISDIRGSAEYRRDMVRIFTKRALGRAISRARGKNGDADHKG